MLVVLENKMVQRLLLHSDVILVGFSNRDVVYVLRSTNYNLQAYNTMKQTEIIELPKKLWKPPSGFERKTWEL